MMRILLTLWLSLAAFGLAQQDSELFTALPLQQVLIGEEALLNIQITGEQPTAQLTAKEESSLSFRTLQPDVIAGRVFSANIGVSSATVGTFTIPAFNIPLQAGTKSSESFTMEVFPTDNIQWQTLNIGSKSYQIGTILLYPSGPIYAGQSVPITAKVLFPIDLPTGSRGFAEIEKDNIGAWRLETPAPPNYDQQVSPRSPNALKPREVRIGGKRYQVVNYVTFAAPLTDGPVTVGPGKIQGLQVQVKNQERRQGFFSSFSRSYNLELEVPQVTFMAKTLPKGAPKDFRGAVGDFTLETSLDITTELKPGDPVIVDIKVKGKGNLDTLAAPVIDAPESNWKLYPSSRNEKEGSRRSNQGSVSFSQILRPLVPIKEVPSFTLSFFNPETSQYETLRTKPIPLNLAPASTLINGIPQAGLVPIAEMQDILGLIEPQAFKARKPFRIGLWWQLFPALIALALAALVIKQQLPKLRKTDPNKDRIQGELSDLAKLKDSDSFLRASAHLAESNGLSDDDFLKELLEERDRSCFQPDNAETDLSQSRKQEILAKLRERLSLLVLFLGLLMVWSPESASAFHEQAQVAWEEGNYQEALDAYELSLKEQATPDLLYNIGNCHYRLDEPGLAALFYHRALELNPRHPEARQNLAFLERKMGAIPPLETGHPEWAKKLSLSVLHTILLLLMWLFLIALLARFARPSSRIQRISNLGLILTAVVALLFIVLRIFHPGEEDSLQKADAILTHNEATEVRTEPSAGGSVILNASPSTTCRILTHRGNWSYIELPNETRGWIESEVLDQI